MKVARSVSASTVIKAASFASGKEREDLLYLRLGMMDTDRAWIGYFSGASTVA
jgi:hypothetical protein